LPAELWKKIMLAAHGGLPPRPLPGTGGAVDSQPDWSTDKEILRPPVATPPRGPEAASRSKPSDDDTVWDSLVKTLIGR
jgi:hypothetical protein